MERPGPTLRTAVRWLPALLWAGVIFAGSSVPGSNIPGGASVYGHLAEYAVLAALIVAAQRTRDRRRAVIAAVALCALYAMSDEIHQSFVPLRTPDVMDWLTDVTGAAVGSAIAVALLRARALPTGSAPGQ
jgi:VanZ like protein